MFDNLEFIAGGKLISKGSWIHQTRTIPTTELIIVTEGVVNMFVGDRRYSAEAGSVLRILPGEKHGGFLESEGVSFFWIHFSGCDVSSILPDISSPANFERVELVAKELLHYAKTDGYPRECSDSMTKVLLLEIMHGYDAKEGSKLIEEVKEWTRRSKEKIQKSSEIASHFGYNEDYLCRIFKKHCGTSLKRYLDSVRLDGIKRELLVGSGTLLEISDAYGFTDYKYFLKFFKYHEGISPRKYRETYYNMHTN